VLLAFETVCRAVSDPRLILDEFPDLVGDRPIGPGPD
jgi:hypothetical protein